MVDVAIVGGGPAGSTTGTLLKKYDPSLTVVIFERERFPRDHVGESQLPGCSRVLQEMGCWGKVEAAEFPIKVGATFLWGKRDELWDFDLAPSHLVTELVRPGQYRGIREHLAFQVDRSIYDQILLEHAREMGCEVHEGARVSRVKCCGDRIEALGVDGVGEVQASWYLDCSGHSGILRRSLGVPVDCPTALKNVAIWRYWRNAQWAEMIAGAATRIQVLSVGFGWMWFIPVSRSRTSVGLVVPASYAREKGCGLEQLYRNATDSLPRIARLLEGALPEAEFQTTSDWSFVSERHSGENWLLVGESGGFADPILSAGLTMTHVAGREAAYTVLGAVRKEDASWLKSEYESRQNRRIRSHIRFADYWYSANSQFSELKQFTSQIAAEAGLVLDPDQAWAWLAQGGFIDDELGATAGSFDLPLLRSLGEFVGDAPAEWKIAGKNVFRLQTEGAAEQLKCRYQAGQVQRVPCLARDGKLWPLSGAGEFWYRLLAQAPDAEAVVEGLRCEAERLGGNSAARIYRLRVFLEALVCDGWVSAGLDPAQRQIASTTLLSVLHPHEEAAC